MGAGHDSGRLEFEGEGDRRTVAAEDVVALVQPRC